MATLSCTNTSCALHGQPVVAAVAEALGMKCPGCQGPLEASGSGLSETAERVIAGYPYPIALPLRLLSEKTDVEAAANDSRSPRAESRFRQEPDVQQSTRRKSPVP